MSEISVSEFSDPTLQLQSRAEFFLLNAVTRAADPASTYRAATGLALDLGYDEVVQTGVDITMCEEPRLASGHRVGTAYKPGFIDYCALDHVRGLTRTIAEAPSDSGIGPTQKALIIGSAITFATNRQASLDEITALGFKTSAPTRRQARRTALQELGAASQSMVVRNPSEDEAVLRILARQWKAANAISRYSRNRRTR